MRSASVRKKPSIWALVIKAEVMMADTLYGGGRPRQSPADRL
jgi:hypothetical protein